VSLDPGELQVLISRLTGVAEEMGAVLRRAAFSPNIKERADCSAAVFDAARAAGKPSVLDGDIGPRDVLLELAARVTHAVFSTPGLARATGTVDPIDGLRAMAARGLPGVMGVTLGAAGFAWIDAYGEIRRAAAPPVQAVDTLAAGDVFHGALTLALAEGRSLGDAAAFANAAAAIKCARFGGRRGAPARSEVNALLAAQR